MTEEEALQEAAKKSKEAILSDAEQADLKDATDKPKGVMLSKSDALGLVIAEQNLALKALQDVITNEQEDQLDQAIADYATAVDNYRLAARDLLALKEAIDDAYDEVPTRSAKNLHLAMKS